MGLRAWSSVVSFAVGLMTNWSYLVSVVSSFPASGLGAVSWHFFQLEVAVCVLLIGERKLHHKGQENELAAYYFLTCLCAGCKNWVYCFWWSFSTGKLCFKNEAKSLCELMQFLRPLAPCSWRPMEPQRSWLRKKKKPGWGNFFLNSGIGTMKFRQTGFSLF